MLGNRAYSAWYSNGIVAVAVSNPTAPTRVGQFVPDVDYAGTQIDWETEMRPEGLDRVIGRGFRGIGVDRRLSSL